MSQELPSRYDPGAVEARLYADWMEAGYFHVPAQEVLGSDKQPYVIVIPPPNVTAALHMGHGLNNTIQDVLIRWRRMGGRAAEWVPGTDHAGIATQNVVERLIAREEGVTRQDLGRDEFVARVWEFVTKTGGTILDQLKAIGCSCDWDRTRFTLDTGLSRAVREVFVRLHEKGLIYRGEYIINWCPRCLTALSNEEAEGEETEGRLYELRYLLAPGAAEAAERAAAAGATAGATAVARRDDGRWYLTVSTTRPETMLGDTGVAVSPDDVRYAHLVGQFAELPLAGRPLPIVADGFVDPEFGTGLVKVTPAHDPNDFEIGRRAGLEVVNVMTPDARMNDQVPERFKGMDRFDARTAVLDALGEAGLLGGDAAHTHGIPRCYRCETVVEPRLSTQWFVRMEPLARPALQAARDGTISFTPGHWKKVYEHWLENIRDWCISRQLWWGHRIPVWYCRDCGETIVARDDPERCGACNGEQLEQDEDVLDTWFSSWLWPFSVFGWPDETDDLKAFYPNHTMVTAPEILFFWVARMIMSGYEFMGQAPFTEVYLHATVRDKRGRKMSKSLGNGIDPLEVVDRFGADALRWTVLSAAAVGTDIRLDHEDLEEAFAPGRNFANKVWNAGRFTLMSVGDAPVRGLAAVEPDLERADRWILSRLQRAAHATSHELEIFRLHEVAEGLRGFFRGELADWYLELVKPRLWGEEGEASREAARATLVHVMDGALRLLHPFIPFVTSALWERLPWPEGKERPAALMVAPWLTADRTWIDEDAEQRLGDLQELVTAVRSLRKEYGVPEGGEVGVFLASDDPAFRQTLDVDSGALARLGRVSTVLWARPEAGTAGAHTVLSNGAELFIPLEGVIDLDRERGRVAGEIERIEALVKASEARLGNQGFVEKAPHEVVQRERERARAQQEQVEKLREKLGLLEGRG